MDDMVEPEDQDGSPLVRELRLEIDGLAAEILAAHPHLRLECWSHSLGEANELDGWTLGFVLTGLEVPLELAIDFIHLRRRPRVARVIVEWLLPLGEMEFIWVDFQGEKEFDECRHAVLRALEVGVPNRNQCFGAAALQVTRHFPEPVYKSSLTLEEQAVYECWLEDQRKISPVPPHIVRQTDSFGLFPENEEARDLLAQLLHTSAEVACAAFPKALTSPELLGPSVVVLDMDWSVEDFRVWRRLYQDKPLCSGIIHLSAIGFHGNRAAMLVVKYSGLNLHEMIGADALATGVVVVTFEKCRGSWVMLESQPVSWQQIQRTFYVGPLFLVTYPWAVLVEAEVTGETLQPTLSLLWKLRSGGQQRLTVTPGDGADDSETLNVGTMSPGTVVEAVRRYFQIT